MLFLSIKQILPQFHSLCCIYRKYENLNSEAVKREWARLDREHTADGWRREKIYWIYRRFNEYLSKNRVERNE